MFSGLPKQTKVIGLHMSSNIVHTSVSMVGMLPNYIVGTNNTTTWEIAKYTVRRSYLPCLALYIKKCIGLCYSMYICYNIFVHHVLDISCCLSTFKCCPSTPIPAFRHSSLEQKVRNSQRILEKLQHRAVSVENSIQHTRRWIVVLLVKVIFNHFWIFLAFLKGLFGDLFFDGFEGSWANQGSGWVFLMDQMGWR